MLTVTVTAAPVSVAATVTAGTGTSSVDKAECVAPVKRLAGMVVFEMTCNVYTVWDFAIIYHCWQLIH